MSFSLRATQLLGHPAGTESPDDVRVSSFEVSRAQASSVSAPASVADKYSRHVMFSMTRINPQKAHLEGENTGCSVSSGVLISNPGRFHPTRGYVRLVPAIVLLLF